MSDRLDHVVLAHGAAAQKMPALIAEQPHAGQTVAQAFDQAFNGRLSSEQY